MCAIAFTQWKHFHSKRPDRLEPISHRRRSALCAVWVISSDRTVCGRPRRVQLFHFSCGISLLDLRRAATPAPPVTENRSLLEKNHKRKFTVLRIPALGIVVIAK